MVHQSRIILTQGVRQYRATVPQMVSSTDAVLEVGCATGKTTKIISAHARSVLAIDQSARVCEVGEHGLPNVRFERWDGWDIDSIRSVSTHFDRVYIDISGSGPPEVVMRLLRCYEATLEPAVIVVKNSRLKTFVARCQIWDGLDGR